MSTFLFFIYFLIKKEGNHKLDIKYMITCSQSPNDTLIKDVDLHISRGPYIQIPNHTLIRIES